MGASLPADVGGVSMLRFCITLILCLAAATNVEGGPAESEGLQLISPLHPHSQGMNAKAHSVDVMELIEEEEQDQRLSDPRSGPKHEAPVALTEEGGWQYSIDTNNLVSTVKRMKEQRIRQERAVDRVLFKAAKQLHPMTAEAVDSVLQRAKGALEPADNPIGQAAIAAHAQVELEDAETKALDAINSAQSADVTAKASIAAQPHKRQLGAAAERIADKSHRTIDVDLVATSAKSSNEVGKKGDEAMESLLPTPSQIEMSPGVLVARHQDGHIDLQRLHKGPTLYEQQMELYNGMIKRPTLYEQQMELYNGML